MWTADLVSTPQEQLVLIGLVHGSQMALGQLAGLAGHGMEDGLRLGTYD